MYAHYRAFALRDLIREPKRGWEQLCESAPGRLKTAGSDFEQAGPARSPRAPASTTSSRPQRIGDRDLELWGYTGSPVESVRMQQGSLNTALPGRQDLPTVAGTLIAGLRRCRRAQPHLIATGVASGGPSVERCFSPARESQQPFLANRQAGLSMYRFPIQRTDLSSPRWDRSL